MFVIFALHRGKSLSLIGNYPRLESLLQTLRSPPHQTIIRKPTPLRARQGSGANITIILRDPPVRIPTLQTLEAVRGDRLVFKVRMLEGLLGRDAFCGVVLEEPREEVEAIGARGSDGRGAGVPAVLEAVLIPRVEAGWAGEVVVARGRGAR